jgi:hypothetical protein
MADPIKKYTGEQIVISSGRLVFNTDANDMLFSAAGKTHFSIKQSFLIDIGEKNSTDIKYKFQVNAPLIQFGSNRLGRTVEPVVKGDSLDALIKDLIRALDKYSKLVSASVPDYAPLLTEASNSLVNDLNLIVQDLNSIKSDVTYTI